MADLVDPALWDEPEMRAALARRDIPTVYRLINKSGITQRRIAELVGQSQSDVWEILAGRAVISYDLLVRIAEGLGIPRGRMGLAYCDVVELQPATLPVEEVDEDVKRREAFATAASLLFGGAVFGEAADLMWWLLLAAAEQSPTTKNVGKADIAALKALTEQLRELARTGHSGMVNVFTIVTRNADQMLTADNISDLPRLLSTLARLHTEAGWSAYDMHLHDRASWHYSRAIELAGDAGDVLAMVLAAQHQAVGYRELGAANESMKLCQLALARLEAAPPLPGRDAELGGLHIRIALAQAELGRAGECTIECNGDHGQGGAHRHAYPLQPHDVQRQVRDQLGRASQYRQPSDDHNAAYLTYGRAGIDLAFGQLDTAEQHAGTALRLWNPEDNRRDFALARIRMATIHAIAGEPDTDRLALQAIDAVDGLRSMRGRALLLPLEQALRGQRDSTSMDLAQRVRQVRQGAS
jgi:transcriptional regulator with XRE-family HTH domain